MTCIRLLQMTDLHLLANRGDTKFGVDPWVSMEAVLGEVNQLERPPDLLVVTGDIAEDGSAETYSHLKSRFQELGLLTYVTPGNHDHFASMQENLLCEDIRMESVLEAGGWNIVFLNTQVEGKVYGQVKAEEVQHIESKLSDKERKPTIVALHHNPKPLCDSPGCQLREDEMLWQLLRQQPEIKAVISGHTHYADESRADGLDGHKARFLSTPSTFVQINHARSHEVDYEKEPQKVHSLDCDKRGCRLIDLYPDGKLETRVIAID